MEKVGDIVALKLPCNRTAPAAARAALAPLQQLDGLREDLNIVTTELVADALLHADKASADHIEVQVSVQRDCVRVTARTDRPCDHAPQHPSDGWHERVLTLISRVWGTEREGGYKVWAELGRTPTLLA